ncbi:MAG: efflux RND transporter permease subunit, partial [Nevskiales bacterium]
LWFPTMQIDTSNESYLHEDDPARLVYDQFQREFGKDERIVILIQSDGDIVNESFLRQLKAWHERLEAINQVDKVESLINARLTLGAKDELIVQDLLEDWPQSEADFALLRERIKNNPLYRNHFVNADLTQTMLIVTPDTYTASYSGADEEIDLNEFDFSAGFDDADALLDESTAQNTAGDNQEKEAKFITDEEIYTMIGTIRDLYPAYQRSDFNIGMAGSPFMMHQLTFIMGRDMFLFSGLGILIISALLFAVFRRWVMVILPVTVSALAVYFTFALMCFFGMVLTTSVQILPSLLLAIGVGNSVHIFTVYFQAVDRGDNKRQALRYALGHSGLAVMMTGLTTAGGLVSFITANMKPVADMGITSPMGILCALLFSLTLLPALIAITPFKDKGFKDDSDGPFQKFLRWCADVSTTYPVRVILLWFVLIAGCLVLVTRIVPSHFPLSWFPQGSEVRDITEAIDANFGGATFSEIIVDTGKENGLHDPQLLQSVDRAMTFVDQLEVHGVRAGKATSLLDINKELHQALNGNNPDFSKMRITIKKPFVDGVLYPDYLEAMEDGFREIVGDQATVTFTGVITILAGGVKVLISDTIRAYVLAFLIIAPLMMLLVGSVRTGLISMIPNLAPIVITMALMAILKIPLDAFTLLVGCIALGLAVDDTIHFMHNFQRYYARMGDAQAAVRETLRTTGKALMITSLVLSSAFFVNMLGTMHNLKAFGLLTGFCIIVAFLADVLLAPALMTLLAHWKEKQLRNAQPVEKPL